MDKANRLYPARFLRNEDSFKHVDKKNNTRSKIMKLNRIIIFGLALLVQGGWGTEVDADVIWINPSRSPANAEQGNLAIARGETHFNFALPDDLTALDPISIVVIGGEDQDVEYGLGAFHLPTRSSPRRLDQRAVGRSFNDRRR